MPGITAEQYYKDQGNINVSAGDIQGELYDTSWLYLETKDVSIGLEEALVFPLIFPQVFQKKMMTIEQVQFDGHREPPNESIIRNPNDEQQSQADDSDIFKLKYWKKNEEALLFLRDEQNHVSLELDTLRVILRINSSDKEIIDFVKRGIILKAADDSEGVRICYRATEEWLSFRLKKMLQIDVVTSYLLKELKELKPEITPYISFGEHGIGEMFIEIQEMFILVRIMSNTIGSKLRWREDRQEIFVCRKNGRKPWQSATKAVQEEFAPQEMLVRENFRLMGVSSRKRKRPLLKVLLLEGITIDPANNPDFLYHDIPEHPYLKIQGNSNVFVFELEGLAKFIAKSVERGNFNPISVSATS
jgi:hypothetical protein